MLCDFDSFQTIVSGLSDESKRIELLTDLQMKLDFTQKNKILLISHSLPLQDVFDCLNTTEEKQVELASDVLATLLSPLEVGLLLNHYGDPIFRALSHPSAKVREMIINVLIEVTRGDAMVQRLCQEHDLLQMIICCLKHSDVSVANAAIKLMVKLGKTETGQGTLFTDPMLKQLKHVLEEQGIVRFRAYEIVVVLAAHSIAGLNAGKISGILTTLLGELTADDTLHRVHAIELLSKLVGCSHGLEYLENKGICEFLATITAAAAMDPLSEVLLPGLIKFFGKIARAWPEEAFAKYPAVISVIFESVENADLEICGAALEAIGFIGSTVVGKHQLHIHDKMSAPLKVLGTHLITMETEWRIRALKVIADLMLITPVSNDYRTLQITRGWFNEICTEPLAVIFAIGKLPIHELQMASLEVMQALAYLQWGQLKIRDTPGILQYLTNRSGGVKKLCRMSKFKMVEIIVGSPVAEDVFGSEVMRHLKEFVKEGPCHVRTESETNLPGFTF